MKTPDFSVIDSKQHLTYYKGWYIYAIIAISCIFLFSIGIVQELLTWNKSVFASTTLMAVAMVFYFRHNLQISSRISIEKDALDVIRKWIENNGTCDDVVFDTKRFLQDLLKRPEFVDTFVADYFDGIGQRIKRVHVLLKDITLVDRINQLKTDDLRFCFYADMNRLIKPLVNAGTKMLLLGFLGTVVGILLIGIGMRFGETAQQTVLIATELIGGLGVAALTTIMGIVGRFVLGSFYEQHEDIRDRIIRELTRMTSVYGLDLYHVHYERFVSSRVDFDGLDFVCGGGDG